MAGYFRIPLLALLIFCGTSYAQEISERQANTARYLAAVGFQSSFENGLISPQEGDNSHPEIDAILALDEKAFTAIVAPLFSEKLTDEEAKLLADFYESEAGKRITTQQQAQPGNPDPAIKLTKQQVAEYKDFIASAGGIGAQKSIAMLQDEEFMQAVFQALVKATGH